MTALPRALIVDDEPEIAHTLRECLGPQYRTELVHSGADALASAERERPDVVLLDVNMPGMSGVEVLRYLKAMHPDLPVIMITATEDTAQIEQTMQLGSLGYIPKPFTRAYVQHLVAAAVQRVKR
jgi:CheY-like chemotaxis protein